MSNKSYFSEANQTKYGSDFQALLGDQIGSNSSNEDSYLRTLFNNYLEYANSSNKPNDSRYKQLPDNTSYQSLASNIGCEFASTRFIANFIKYVETGRMRGLKDVQSTKALFESLQRGSIGQFFADPTFGQILGFHLDFHRVNRAFSQIAGMERLQSLCIVD